MHSLLRKLITLLTGIWLYSDIYTKDIEFGYLFAKFIEISCSDSERPKTQDVLKLYKMLLDAVNTAKAKGFAKKYLAEKITSIIYNVCVKPNHQIKHLNIKALCCTLIINYSRKSDKTA
jgi:hypothetical protein